MKWEEAVALLREDPAQTDLVRACYYDDPLEAAADRFYQSEEWHATRRLLGRSTGRALELGAGRGIASYALGRDGWQATAAEPDSSEMVGAGAVESLARTAGLDLRVVRAAGEALPFRDATFDLVYCRAVLHHARDLQKLCREAVRVLKPGGLFLATREHVISRREDLPLFLAAHPLHRYYGGENAYLLCEYQSAIQSAGIRRVRSINPFASPINLFPQTVDDARKMISTRLRIPKLLVPRFVVPFVGHALEMPGRLYSFFGTKSIT